MARKTHKESTPLTRTKEMAPLSPANQITHCILTGIGRCRPALAMKDSGKMLHMRPTRQNAVHSREKVKLMCRNRPVKTPMPMYRNTKYSLSTARDLMMLCAVT